MTESNTDWSVVSSASGPHPLPSLTEPKRRTSKKTALIAALVGVVGLLAGAGITLLATLPEIDYYEGSRDHFRDAYESAKNAAPETIVETKTQTVTATPSPTTTTAPPSQAGPKTTFGPGTWKVGTDIAPGTYKASGDLCYWARLSGFSGQLDDIIANGNGTGGQIIVTISEDDVAFESNRCGTWTPA